MSPLDVLRGVKRAYLVGLAIMALPTFAILIQHPTAALAFAVVTALAGLMLAVPAALAALAVFYGLRCIIHEVRWWMPPLACTLLLAAVFWGLEPAPGTLVYAVFLGPLFGLAFWSGAVGNHRRAKVERPHVGAVA